MLVNTIAAIAACVALSPDPAVSPDGWGQAVGEPGETNGRGVITAVTSPDPAVSPDGWGQAVGEPGETNCSGNG